MTTLSDNNKLLTQEFMFRVWVRASFSVRVWVRARFRVWVRVKLVVS